MIDGNIRAKALLAEAPTRPMRSPKFDINIPTIAVYDKKKENNKNDYKTIVPVKRTSKVL